MITILQGESQGDSIISINPATGEKIGEVPVFSPGEARDAVRRAREAQVRWGAAPLEDRVRVISRFADILLDEADGVSRLISTENGKVLQESFQMEVFPIVDLTKYFCRNAEHILEKKKISLHLLKHRRSYIDYRPRGVVLVISPWNFPFTIPFGEVVMALLAGNAVILKPASNTPLIALKGKEIFDRAGLDRDLFQVVTGPGKLGSDMVEMGVDYVNFTGSVEVGTEVAALCGRLLIPCTMELGGKDAAIVLPDAKLEHAARSILWGSFANAGQMCSAVERVYIHEKVYDPLVEMLVLKAMKLRVGNPLDDGVDMGPMTDPRQLEKVERRVKAAVAAGAKVLLGGKRREGPGQFYLPTILADVHDGMEIMKEETFGPVLPVMKVGSVEEAVAKANGTSFGLSAYVFTSDPKEGRRVAESLEAGTVMINETLITHAAPETPWGGVKKSGIGRVHSDDGLRHLAVPYHINEDAGLSQPPNPFWQPYSHKAYHALVAAARALDHSNFTVRLSSVKKLFCELSEICDAGL